MSFIHIPQPCPASPEYLFPGFLTHGSVIRFASYTSYQSDARLSLPPARVTQYHGPDLVDDLGFASIMTAHGIDDYSLRLS